MRATANWTLIWGLLTLACWTGCTKPKVEPVTAPPPEVTVMNPVARNVTEFFEYVGRTESPDFVEVRARVTGYLMQVHFTDGQEVEKDDPLFEIDPRPYQFTLENAQARLKQAQSQLRLAELTLERNKALVPSNSISQQDLDEAIQKQANAAAELDSATTAVGQAKLDLDFCSIKAPIAGRLSQANIKVGNLISNNQVNAPALTTIASVDPIRVAFDVDEQAVLKYREYRRSQGVNVEFKNVRDLHQKVLVALANETTFAHEGVLDFIDNQVRTSTGTLLVRAELPNQDRLFAPGFFVRVRVPFGEEQMSLLVPDRAILNDQSIKYVLVVDQNNVAQRRDVEVGVLDDGMRVIRSGIEATDHVIVNGIQRARPGVQVKPSVDPKSSATSAKKEE